MALPLDFKEEVDPAPSKADELNFHNARLSKLLREQQFFQTQNNDYMVDKLQGLIEMELEAAKNRKVIL